MLQRSQPRRPGRAGLRAPAASPAWEGGKPHAPEVRRSALDAPLQLDSGEPGDHVGDGVDGPEVCDLEGIHWQAEISPTNRLSCTQWLYSLNRDSEPLPWPEDVGGGKG
jgi:hypothetical protein